MAKQHLAWLLPIVLFGLLTPFTPVIDLGVAHFFYRQGQFVTTPFYDLVFHYAVYPAFIVGGFSLSLLGASFFCSSLRKWRSISLVLVLSLVLGAGFIAHTLLKDRWGRPRPRQVEQFGGRQRFLPYYQPNFLHQIEPSKSFPCGHCTMGFYFFAVALVCQRMGWRYTACLNYGLALSLGILLGVTRMAQGGHFFSDVVASALIMWLTPYFLINRFLKNNYQTI